MKANLHIHTTNSDGTKTVKEINEIALKNHFDLVAITDHDTVEAIDEINKLDPTVNFIIGVEMTCEYNNENIHILGYFGHDVPSNVRKYFQKESGLRVKRCQKILDNLRRFYDIDIAYEDVAKNANGIIARPHIASAISKKYGCSYQEAFDYYISNENKAYVPCDVPNLDTAIQFLKNNGALVSLAHPVRITTFDYREILDKGFDGIEVYHPEQDKQIRGELLSLAYYYDLIVTGGSDYHGDIIDVKFEESYINGDNVNDFVAALGNLNQKQGPKVKTKQYYKKKVPVIK